MSLPAGQRVGAYEVIAPLGAGGMGEVYRARDPRLDREVAIKVLSADVAGDADRLRRFEQEARSVGALNHPHVLAVHDFGVHEGAPYMVMELLEGETLRQKLRAGSVPWRRALGWGREIASGLAAAHEKGIVHRDLKPENLFITKDGRVKILDFGLARTTVRTGSGADSTVPATEPGAMLGTAGYMAPEQVRGRPADARADVFSFGAVLYEALAGRRAFVGESLVEQSHAILHAEPVALADSGVMVPPGVERVVRRCLEKDPAERFQSARDLGFALEAVAEGSGASTRFSAVVPTVPRPSLLRPPLLLVAALVLVALGVAFGSLRSRPRAPVGGTAAPAATDLRFTRVTFRQGVIDVGRFAEGGRSVVFSGLLGTDPPQVFLATPGQPETRAVAPPWSQLVALSRQGEMLLGVVPEGATHRWHLARAPLVGGAPREVLESYESADLGPDGGLLAVRQVQGQARLEYPLGTTRLELTGMIAWPRVSPRGEHVAFLHWPVKGDDRGTLELLDLRSGMRRTLAGPFQAVEGLAWRPDGGEVWFSAGRENARGSLRAVTLDGRERSVLAALERLEPHDLAADGRALLRRVEWRFRVAALVAPGARETDLTWFDGSYVVDLTADGKWLLLGEGGEASKRETQVFVRRTDGAPAIALGDGLPLALSPDGSPALGAPSAPFDRLSLVPTGPGETRALPPGDFTEVTWARFFADGMRILILARARDGAWRLWIQALEGGAPRPVGPAGVDASTPPSPDGTRVVVLKDQAAVLVPLDGGPAQALPGIRRGDEPLQWTADGRALYVLRQPPRHPKLEAEVVVHDLAAGTERLWRVLAPPDPVGAHRPFIKALMVTPDGRSYSYWYVRANTDLYVVEGLR
ncbi:MAG: serine/threonine-protein kinase [Deltaproteobacteria bacterium]|nr:serine/threonine-protein kinase [Deltaproteobacteria bacterium]